MTTSKRRTDARTCRHKVKYADETAALASLRSVYLMDPERNGEQRAYLCDKGDHWHLTKQGVLGNAQVQAHIQLLSRTIEFLLVKAGEASQWKREAEYWRAQHQTLARKVTALGYGATGAHEPSPVERAEIRSKLEKVRQATERAK